jgi:DNA-binding GntR family transcriptional regulator
MRAATDARIFPSRDRYSVQASFSLPARILKFLRLRRADAGACICVESLCRQLGAPPQPVRDALNLLAIRGTLDFIHGRDFVLAAAPGCSIRLQTGNGQFLLMQAILTARRRQLLPQDCSVDDVALAMDVRKKVAAHAMEGLEELGLAMRRPAGRWQVGGIDAAMLLESYRFRLAVEPACLRSWQTDMLFLARLKQQHCEALAYPRDRAHLSRLDREFHLCLAAQSGNRYMSEAVGRQIEIASLWEERSSAALKQDLEDHLAILAALEAGQEKAAAGLLTRHLEQELQRQSGRERIAT